MRRICQFNVFLTLIVVLVYIFSDHKDSTISNATHCKALSHVYEYKAIENIIGHT